jgi:hypothetical protein
MSTTTALPPPAANTATAVIQRAHGPEVIEIGPYPLLPGWRVCGWCPVGDNVWPDQCFYPSLPSQCKACYIERRAERSPEWKRRLERPLRERKPPRGRRPLDDAEMHERWARARAALLRRAA